MIIGFIPHHWAMLASAIIQISAQTAARTISKTLTDRYLRRANTTYFEPRGLKVRLMKTAAVRRFLQLRQNEGEVAEVKGKGKMKAFGQSAGRLAEQIGMHLPITGRIIPMFQKPPTKIPTEAEIAAVRMAQFSGTTPPLALTMSTLALPAPRQPKGLMDKGSALSIKLEIWRANRREAKDKRARQLLDVAQGRAPPESLDEEFWKGTKSGIAGTGIRSWVDTMRARQVVNSAGDDSGSQIGLLTSVRWNSSTALALASVGLEKKAWRTKDLELKVHKADRMEMLRNEELIWVVLLNEENGTCLRSIGVLVSDGTANRRVPPPYNNANQINLSKEPS
ncbi:hypothetical protein DL93DRAFT_788289 [Clavulina sp. PMI_390]|nr:hypothetical protein DL93DRAFT_788289 [Clavulina sp. PMI_390]